VRKEAAVRVLATRAGVGEARRRVWERARTRKVSRRRLDAQESMKGPQLEPVRTPHPGFRSGASVWLFRHGEVHEDFQGLAYGGMDVPLSREGREQSERLAERFGVVRFDHVVASTLQRARYLGEQLAQRSGAPLELDAGLVEIDRGRWQGLPQKELLAKHEADVEAFYNDPWNWRRHGGETDSDVLARAWPVLERTVREHGAQKHGVQKYGAERHEARGHEAAQHGASLAIVCHYNVVRNLVAHALGLAPTASFRVRIDLTAGALLHDSPEGWRLVRCNVRTPRGAELRAGAGGELGGELGGGARRGENG
jgi:broad specificity phosphatase PhoE